MDKVGACVLPCCFKTLSIICMGAALENVHIGNALVDFICFPQLVDLSQGIGLNTDALRGKVLLL